MFPDRAEGRGNKKLLAFARRKNHVATKGARAPSCDECRQLFHAGHKSQYPCADCPAKDGLRDKTTYEIFCAAASYDDRKGSDGYSRRVFDVNWQLVALLIDVKGIPDREETVEKLIALVKGLNA
jgi:hypothetical protein